MRRLLGGGGCRRWFSAAGRPVTTIPDVCAPRNLVPIPTHQLPTITPILHDLSLHSSKDIDRFRVCVMKTAPVATPGYKAPAESFIEILLPFSRDATLRELYKRFESVDVRVGKVLEEVDALAGDVAYRHTEGLSPLRPLTLVTARADLSNLRFGSCLRIDRDLRLRGYPTYVGSSSMEVRIDMCSIGADDIYYASSSPSSSSCNCPAGEYPLGYATLTMVALDKHTQKPVPINWKLQPVSEGEKALFSEAERRREMAKKAAKQQAGLSEEERKVLEELVLSAREFTAEGRKKDWLYMAETRRGGMQIMHSQMRNIHNKMFGGHLMRIAVELSYAVATLVFGCHPNITGAGDVTFHQPVPVGSLLQLESEVVYSEGDAVLVRTTATVIHEGTQSSETLTDIFHFTFQHPEGRPAPRIIPQTLSDAMAYVEGARIFRQQRKA